MTTSASSETLFARTVPPHGLCRLESAVDKVAAAPRTVRG
jgi:hypothetical protein